MQKQADQRRRDRDSATFKNEIAKVLEETMMSTSKYAMNHSIYSPPPKSDTAKYRKSLEERMHRTAEVIVHGRRLGTCVITQEKELSVMKWMMWQLKP
eukprot:5553281-Pyramimonas_sp.AAC.1